MVNFECDVNGMVLAGFHVVLWRGTGIDPVGDGMGQMEGKVVMLTGPTGGIGRATALGLAQMNPTMVLVARDRERCEAVAAQIKAAGCAQVFVLIGDLSLQRDVHRVAEEFKARFDTLDVLINNAGAIFQNRRLTEDGLEWTWALNHLSYFLLTNLLLDVLKDSSPARIICVASTAHRTGRIRFDDLNLEKGWSPMKAYSQSKLANILFVRELSRRLEGSGVTANAVHPGVVATNFGKNDGGIFAFLVKMAGPLFISPEKGARTSIHLASSSTVEGISGEYWAKSKVASLARQAQDDEAARRLWEISLEQVRQLEPPA